MQWLWQLPQNIVGFIIKRIYKAEHRLTYKTIKVYVWNRNDGASLGNYIFIPLCADLEYVKHEYGHTVQSRKLGWLYLLVIMTPSMIWNACFEKYRERTGVDYYSFWTERWADKLGEVTR